MRNYLGLLVSPKLYAEHGYVVENKLVFSSHTNDEKSRERLWFMCGYQDSTLIVISRGSGSEKLLVESGILIDLTAVPRIDHPSSFFDYALHRLSSRSERVRLCNTVRNILSARTRYRWCGAELESIFDSQIVKNACEINGLALLGRAISHEGILVGVYPEVLTTNYSFDVFQSIQSMDDDGQKKLAAVFHSIAIAHSSIIYVGSAPGTGWIAALRCYPNVERVLSIDPRDLDSHDDSRIIHYKEPILTASRLYEIAGDRNNCVLIWDVRGDAKDDHSRDAMITDEIAILNSIVNDSRKEMKETVPIRMLRTNDWKEALRTAQRKDLDIRPIKEKMKTRCNKDLSSPGFSEGSLVWLHNPVRKKGISPKLQARWDGPYRVVTRINDVTYRIQKGPRGAPKVVHVDRLARYHGSNDARDEHV